MVNSPGIFPPTSASGQDYIKTCLLLGQTWEAADADYGQQQPVCAFSKHRMMQKMTQKKSCFSCIWLRAQNIQEHNDYPGYLHSAKEIRAVTRVSKWVLHVLSQDSSSSWESRVEEKRGGIVISLHRSQIIPLPEIKWFTPESCL